MVVANSGDSADLGGIDLPASVDGTSAEAKDGDTAGAKVEVETPEDGQTKPEENNALQKTEEAAHLAALETVKLMFADKYSDAERVEFFKEHPELADVANRSKKFKEQFRDLQKRSEKGEITSEDTKAEKPRKKHDETTEETLTERILNKVREENVLSERRKSARDYAVTQGLNEDDFGIMHGVAEAIYKANADISYQTALKAALVSLGKEGSTKPIVMPTGESQFKSNATQPNADKTSEVKRIMQVTRTDKVTAEKIYNSGKSMKGDITKEGIEIPTDF